MFRVASKYDVPGTARRNVLLMRILSRFLTLALLCLPLASGAQVLTRPGWVGTGVTSKPWWQRAVFYRIQPALFQDSNHDGKGDLKGIEQRLPYLQKLGIDAIILEPPFSEDDFGDLVRQASEAHIRVLVQLSSPDPALARHWLYNGAAGLFVDGHALSTNAPLNLAELRHLTDSFPGGRVLLTSGIDTQPGPHGPELAVQEVFTANKPEAGVLRQQLASNLAALPGSGNILLQLTGVPVPAGSPSQQDLLDRTLALMLLGSRAAVLIDAGRELGLRSAHGQPVLMQWTPTNVTEAARPEEQAKSKGSSVVYRGFVAYVKPAHLPPLPPPPQIEVTIAAPPPDPGTLPGFTSGKLSGPMAINGKTANAAEEDANPNSLLNFYRKLIALHHGNFTLRDGSQKILDEDDLGALVWTRSGSASSTPAVIVCNLSGKPLDVNLTPDLNGIGMRSGWLRPLLTATVPPAPSGSSSQIFDENTSKFSLPAGSVFLGELDGSGTYAGSRSHHRR